MSIVNHIMNHGGGEISKVSMEVREIVGLKQIKAGKWGKGIKYFSRQFGELGKIPSKLLGSQGCSQIL